jgi:2-dehydropantoate 2-reductase
MKIVMMGSGGIGGYYGARLAQAGNEVVFVARGAHAEAMRRNGLRIESDLGPALIQPATVVADPREAGRADLVVIAVKLWDTETAARAVAPIVGPDTAVVSLQNGIDKDETIAACVGRAAVLGGLTYIGVTVSAPGVITQAGVIQRIVIGELDGALSPRAAAIGAAMRAAGFDAEVTADIRRASWGKFVFLAAHSATTAATRQPIGRVREHPATRELLLDAMREGMALAAAEGVGLGDDFLQQRMAFADSMAPESRASMAHDLLRGNRLELDWLSGTIVRRAKAHGLATPVHRTLYAVLALFADGSRPEAASA